jgi:pyridoxine 5-phosphate synthase
MNGKGFAALSVNLNKVALLRNARTLGVPSVVRAAELCLAAGAHGITVHPRPDERHIRASDVEDLSLLMKKNWSGREFNIEGNPLHNLMPLVQRHRPEQATLVPDSQSQVTSDHGWSFPRDMVVLAPLVEQLKKWGVRVSLFMDPDPSQMHFCKELGADRVELYTEQFAKDMVRLMGAWPQYQAQGLESDRGFTQETTEKLSAALRPYVECAQSAFELGLGVNAGHDLNAQNVPVFLAHVPHVLELSIGHAFMADALELGYAQAVELYLKSMAHKSSVALR